MTEYQFTKDWFQQAPEVWKQIIPYLPGNPGSRHFLEIGSFEGRSAVWIAENMMAEGDELRCIDTWKGSEEHSAEDMGAVEDRFRHNIVLAAKRLPGRRIFQTPGTSVQRLAEFQGKDEFDFIYIDGSHIAKDVLTDACMAWSLLKSGGLMVLDDYLWGNPRDVLHRPKLAIDAFANIFAEQLDIIHAGYQFVVQKRKGG